MNLELLLLIVLVFALFGAVPRWGWSNSWGYGPSGVIGVILLVLVILYLTGHRFR